MSVPLVVEWPGPGRIAVMPRPAGGAALADDLRSLRAAGVDTLVSALTEAERERLDLVRQPEIAMRAGLSYVAFPIADFGVPAIDDLRALARRLADETAEGRFVVVHCFGGIGRSGMIACATLIRLGATAEQAMALVSRARGFPVPETPAQRDLLRTLAQG